MTGNKTKGRLLSAGDISLFCSQLALLLQAAVSLEEGIGTIRENVPEPKAQKLVLEIESTVAQGGLLSQGLKRTGAFPSTMVHLVEIGEKAGRLDEVMDALARYYDREQRLHDRIRSAIFYPLLLLLMMAAVIGILVVRVLPIFEELFASLNGGAVSSMVLQAGITAGRAALIVVAVLGVFLLAALRAGRTSPGAGRLGQWLSRFGPGKRISEQIASARFAWAMSMLLSSGLDTAEALAEIPAILPNKQLARRVELCGKAVGEGQSLADALNSTHIFSGMYASLIRIGSKTGRIDAVMQRLAEIYEEEADAAVGNAVSAVELAQAAVLSVIVGGILLSVMLPLMGVLSSVG